jgi:hypothetical protein
MKTKLLITIIICSLQSLSLIGMNDSLGIMINSYKKDKSSVNLEAIKQEAEKRWNNGETKKVSFFLHPDKNKDHSEIGDLLKDLNSRNNKEITLPEETSAEKKIRKKKEKTERYQTDINFLNSYKNQTIAYGYHSLTNTKRSLIEKTVQSLFSIVASKITPDCLKNKDIENITADYKSYRQELEKETSDNYNEARNRLNQYLKKDN